MKVVAITTISLDGRITPPNAEGTPFSSAETRNNFFHMLGSYDAVISGRVTFDVVKSMMLSTKHASENSPLNIILTRDPGPLNEQYNGEAVEFSALAPVDLIRDLQKRGCSRVLIAGGGEIYSMYANSGLVDEWICVIEPLLLGEGKLMMPSIGEQKLELLDHRLLNQNTILLHYKRTS